MIFIQATKEILRWAHDWSFNGYLIDENEVLLLISRFGLVYERISINLVELPLCVSWYIIISAKYLGLLMIGIIWILLIILDFCCESNAIILLRILVSDTILEFFLRDEGKNVIGEGKRIHELFCPQVYEKVWLSPMRKSIVYSIWLWVISCFYATIGAVFACTYWMVIIQFLSHYFELCKVLTHHSMIFMLE